MSEGPDSQFLGFVTCKSCDDADWYVDLDVNGNTLNFKLDTGADVTVISRSTFMSMSNRPRLRRSSITLKSPGGDLQNEGQFLARTSYIGKAYHFLVQVVSNDVTSLLGRSVCVKLGLVARIHAIESQDGHNQKPSIGLLKCVPVKISLKADAVPYSVATTRRVPIHLRAKVEGELKRMVEAGIVTEVTEATEWCAPMVPVVKKSGDIRICVDLKRLNESIIRPKYVIPIKEDILSNLSGAAVFSCLDAASGFWQIPLDKDSSYLTTFITPSGRFCFNRLPFGITSAPEIFQLQMTELLRGLDGVVVFMDDILVYGCDMKDHDECLNKVMKVLNDKGLKLNMSKCKFRQDKITFLGQSISKDGVGIDEDKVKAVQNLPEPTNVMELRRALGMINYLGSHLSQLSSVLKPLNDLLKGDVSWYWGPEQESAFNKVKQMISSAPILAYFDPARPTVVSADASSYGLGGVLMQYHGKSLRPVAYCSRTLSQAEKGYSQIEKECLACVWGCEKFDMYLRGLQFQLMTDHRPLVPLMNTRDLDKVPIRCQRLLIRFMRYNPRAMYVPGQQLVVADTLSRTPQPEEPYDLEQEISAHVAAVERAWPISNQKLDRIRETTADDDELQTVMKYTVGGWPTHLGSVCPIAQPYFNIRSHISVHDGLLTYDDRIIIPRVLRSDVLYRLHDGHQGLTRCRQRAQQSVWWQRLAMIYQRLSLAVSVVRFTNVRHITNH